MKKYYLCMLALFTLLVMGCGDKVDHSMPPNQLSVIKLPEPSLIGDMSLEETLHQRRSVREYSAEPIFLTDISQLLWAAQGITSDQGWRTAPSAGGLYPLEVYLVAGKVEGLPPGSYKYLPKNHELILVKSGDLRAQLAVAAWNQEWVEAGAINIVISAIYKRTTQKYGDRGITYVHMEAGHAAQNICLEVVALKLGGVTVGAFNDNEVKKVVGMVDNEVPLYVIPVGQIA